MDLYNLIEKIVTKAIQEGPAKVSKKKRAPLGRIVDTSDSLEEEEEQDLDEVSSAGGAGGVSSVEGYSSPLSREDFVEELQLREVVRKAINIHRDNKNKSASKEIRLREVIHEILKEEDVGVDLNPNRPTGIRVLEDLLGVIVPVLSRAYKQLTTNKDQRRSFRAHIISAAESALKPARINDEAGRRQDEFSLQEEEGSGLRINIEDEDMFIPVDGDIEEPTEQDKFGIEGQNLTGRNMAFETFKKIETNITKAYELLGDKEDEELFYDYLITNLKLHFDKFEDQISPSVAEPTTDEYEEQTG